MSAIRQWPSRLHLGALWLAHSWRFRWAHKPLCDRFRREIVRVGPVRVCRSCLMLYAGLAIGILAVALLRAPLRDVGVWLFLACGAVVLPLSAPQVYRYWPRLMRDGLRFLTGVTAALCAYLLLSGQPVVGLAGATALLACWKIYKRIRGRRRERTCNGCPQLTGDNICTGYALQAASARRYEEQATAFLLATGYVPAVFKKNNG